MIIKNGNVFQEDGSYKVTDLYIENGRIAASEDEVTDKTQLDAAGLKVLPGLVDIHSHGAVRHDFSDADVDGLKIILQYEKSPGNHFLLPDIHDPSERRTAENFPDSKRCRTGRNLRKNRWHQHGGTFP